MEERRRCVLTLAPPDGHTVYGGVCSEQRNRKNETIERDLYAKTGSLTHWARRTQELAEKIVDFVFRSSLATGLMDKEQGRFESILTVEVCFISSTGYCFNRS